VPGGLSEGGAGAVIPTNRVYLACRALFETYPLAVVPVDHVPTMQAMVLVLANGPDVNFFVLACDCGDERPAYTVVPWHAEGPVTIEPDGGDVPEPAASAVMRGVPIPRDGSLFGCLRGGLVTALIVIYASYAPDRPVPTWSVMPLAETPEEQWPAFTDRHMFGHWFWDHHRAGEIIDLGEVIAATADTVFWLDTYAGLGSDCCAVACDVKTPGGHILRRGRYLGSAALRAGVAVPALAKLLADVSKIDLASRFRVPAHYAS
jgi:hypothetical protein